MNNYFSENIIHVDAILTNFDIRFFDCHPQMIDSQLLILKLKPVLISAISGDQRLTVIDDKRPSGSIDTAGHYGVNVQVNRCGSHIVRGLWLDCHSILQRYNKALPEVQAKVVRLRVEREVGSTAFDTALIKVDDMAPSASRKVKLSSVHSQLMTVD